jgi:predicted acylesterase/phospholipase RssA
MSKKLYIGEKHYCLAFQGGGAKGIAYVGAYKALKKTKYQNQEIPIKSILGSSAGGIIALAISTNIEAYEV